MEFEFLDRLFCNCTLISDMISLMDLKKSYTRVGRVDESFEDVIKSYGTETITRLRQ